MQGRVGIRHNLRANRGNMLNLMEKKLFKYIKSCGVLRIISLILRKLNFGDEA